MSTRAILTVNSLDTLHGGPSRSIMSLARALAERDWRTSILTHASGEAVDGGRGGMHVVSVDADASRELVLPFQSPFGLALAGMLHGTEATVLHDNGLWLPCNHATASVAARLKVPRIVTTRGMLSPWARRQSGVKKFLAWLAYQRRDVQTAYCVHTTSEAETGDVRAAGIHVPVAVIPNGVHVPMSPRDPAQEKRPRRALFLGRIHPVKGIDDLLIAWPHAAENMWELVVAGPGEHADLTKRVNAAAHTGSSVRYLGEVGELDKWSLLESSDLLVLPSRSENFGIVIAEALAAGVPVITTKAAPWRELETHRCGWWIDTGVEPLVGALRHAMRISDDERRTMGLRGRKLVEANYSWDEIAGRMIAVYEWLLGRRSRPDWVYT